MAEMHNKNQDRRALWFLILSVPLFFPLIAIGRIPGPFAVGATDTFTTFEPYALLFVKALKAGENPFWSHVASFGSPTLLALGTGALHPFHLFHLVMPDWLAFALGWWARLALFGAYFFLYLRGRGVRPWVALSFALFLSYGSFFISYSQEIIGYTVAFFPMVLYYADKVCIEHRLKDGLMLALSVSCLILGGFPSVILYLLLTLAAYILFMSKGWRMLICAGLACVTGFITVLPALIETLTFYPSSGYDPAQRSWLFFYTPPATTWLNLLIPSLFGDIFQYYKAGMRDFYGSLLGAGILTFSLSLVIGSWATFTKRLTRRDSDIIFWLSVLFVCLTVYFDLFCIKRLLQYLPILNEHPFTRLQTLITVASAASASLLIEHLLRSNIQRKIVLRLMAAVGVILGAAYTYASVSYIATPIALQNVAVFGLIGITSLVALAFNLLRPTRFAKVSFVALAIVLAVVTSLRLTFYFQPHEYYPERGLISHVKEHLISGARILDINNILFHQTAAAYNVPSITNHWFSPPELRAWVSQLGKQSLHRGLSMDTLSSLNGDHVWESLRQMHVQFVASPENNYKTLLPQAAQGDWRLVSSDGNGVVLIEVLYGGAHLTREKGLSGLGYSKYIEGGGRVRFQVDANCDEVTIPVRFHRNWHPIIGASTVVADSRHLITVIPNRDASQIEIAYSPRNLPTYILIALISWLLCAVCLRYVGGEKTNW